MADRYETDVAWPLPQAPDEPAARAAMATSRFAKRKKGDGDDTLAMVLKYLKSQPLNYPAMPGDPNQTVPSYDPNVMGHQRNVNAVRPISGEGRTESEESRAANNDPYWGMLETALNVFGPTKAGLKAAAVGLPILAASTGEAEASKIKPLQELLKGAKKLTTTEAAVPLPKGRASADEINRAAAESRKGATQPELRALYERLGLTGGAPSELVSPSLAQTQTSGARQAAIDLKLADRAFLDTLTDAQRKEFMTGGKVPAGTMLPSKEAAAPALAEFAPLKKEVGKAEKAFDENVLLNNRPTLFDLSPETLRQTPNVPQFNLPRVAPKQTERLEGVSRGGIQRLERAAALAPLENWGWYNLMQARDVFHGIHGPQKGEQAFNGWLDAVAGTSMVNPIDNNIRSSTWYLQQMLQGKPLPDVLSIADPVSGKMVKTMAGGPPPGYGAKSQIQHADRVKEYLTGTYDPVTNPKPISYRMNLGGNWMPRTVDTHDIRNMVGMPQAKTLFGAEDSALLPGEYSYLEGVGGRAATRAKEPQAAQQAATWVGGGEYTGLKSYPAPLLEALNRRAHVTGTVKGISPWDALVAAFSGKAPLLGYGGAAAVPVAGGVVRQGQQEYQ